MGTITVVTSGKGGAGKSTVSAGLGCALADLGHKVLLLDGDAGLRSLDLMLGVSSATVYDMADVFAGRCEPVRAIYPSPICRDVSVIAAPVHLEQLCSPEDMRRLCQSFVQHFDDLIIDCPAGIGSGFEPPIGRWWSPHRTSSAPVTPTSSPICWKPKAFRRGWSSTACAPVRSAKERPPISIRSSIWRGSVLSAFCRTTNRSLPPTPTAIRSRCKVPHTKRLPTLPAVYRGKTSP